MSGSPARSRFYSPGPAQTGPTSTLAASAAIFRPRVRYSRRGKAANVIGLELNQQVRRQMQESLRETPSGS